MNLFQQAHVKNDKDFQSEDISHFCCCDNQIIESRNGNEVCLNCGMIFERIYVTNERRAYTFEEISNRRRTEPRWRNFGPRTLLPITNKDSKGHSIAPQEKALFLRLSKIQNSLISSIERNFWEAKPKLNLLCSKMNIPDYIVKMAWKIYKIVAKKKLTMGRSIDGFIAGSLYVAIRVHEFPRLLDEICDTALIPRRTVIQSLGMIIREILPLLGLKYSPITVESLIYRFGNELSLPMSVQKKAINLYLIASKKGLEKAGKDPKGLAAAFIYIASKDASIKKTQSFIAEIARITEVTLRSRTKQIKDILTC
ncbi:MAG: transcription initiation factor IIB [Promethearchaeota archaeon]